MSWAAIAATVVGAGLSAGVAYASQPELVDPAKSSRKTVLASLKALPGQRAVERAARLGQRIDYPTGQVRPKYERISPEEALKRGVIDQATYDRNKVGRYAVKSYRVAVPDGGRQITREADFTGYGDADVQGELSRKLAQVTLDLQKKYGTQFVDEARKQQELADPEGTEARKLLASEINRLEDEREGRARPIASKLDAQLLSELRRGKGVSDETAALTERIMARRGDVQADVTGDMETGAAGENLLRQRLQKAMSYLGSGVSPEDAAYRERQQSLANMASFLGGRTPQSQFASLSGGQQGASPAPRGPALPGVDPNLTGNAQLAGVQSYSAGVRNAATQVSPWFMGLSALTKGVQAYNAGRPT